MKRSHGSGAAVGLSPLPHPWASFPSRCYLTLVPDAPSSCHFKPLPPPPPCRYLTTASALWRFLTAPARMGKYFDAEGNPVYPEETERM